MLLYDDNGSHQGMSRSDGHDSRMDTIPIMEMEYSYPAICIFIWRLTLQSLSILEGEQDVILSGSGTSVTVKRWISSLYRILYQQIDEWEIQKWYYSIFGRVRNN